MAGEAQEPALLEAYRSGEDVHKLTAAKMLGVPLEEVTNESSAASARLCNLALQYQLSAPSLAERLGVPTEEGQRLYDAWFAAYPRIKAWTEATVAQARQDGYTMSRFGRKHPIWEFAKVCDVLPGERRAVQVDLGPDSLPALQRPRHPKDQRGSLRTASGWPAMRRFRGRPPAITCGSPWSGPIRR